MSGTRSTGRGTADPSQRDLSRRVQPRVQLPLLDRLIDDNPFETLDKPMSSAEALEALRGSVRRDLAALLNARRRWRSWPAAYGELTTSPVGFGLTDLAAGTMADAERLEAFRADVEDTIRRFEPRLAKLRVSLHDDSVTMDATLRLRIDGMLHADPAPEPVAFDTVVDPGFSEITVEASRDV